MRSGLLRIGQMAKISSSTETFESGIDIFEKSSIQGGIRSTRPACQSVDAAPEDGNLRKFRVRLMSNLRNFGVRKERTKCQHSLKQAKAKP